MWFFSLLQRLALIVLGIAILNNLNEIGEATAVKATYWSEKSDTGGCQLPGGNITYSVTDALALGIQAELGGLVWRSGLCGQVLAIECGSGISVDAVVVSPCGQCGLDLIGQTWRKVTGGQEPGVTRCSARLSSKNPIQGRNPLCFHRPESDIGNLHYAAIGVLNTDGRISQLATLAGLQSRPRSNSDAWFQFNSPQGLFNSEAPVVFYFEDGTTATFQLKDCAHGGTGHIFGWQFSIEEIGYTINIFQII